MDYSSLESFDDYLKLYNASIDNSEQFWNNVANRISWFVKYDQIKRCDYKSANIEWYLNGKLNVSYNCIDRHIENGLGDSTAIIWQGNNDNESSRITYNQLLKDVCKFSNGLKSLKRYLTSIFTCSFELEVTINWRTFFLFNSVISLRTPLLKIILFFFMLSK